MTVEHGEVEIETTELTARRVFLICCKAGACPACGLSPWSTAARELTHRSAAVARKYILCALCRLIAASHMILWQDQPMSTVWDSEMCAVAKANSLPSQLHFLLLFVTPLTRRSHVEILLQKQPCFRLAASEQDKSVLVVLLSARRCSNRGDVVLQVAEVGHDL